MKKTFSFLFVALIFGQGFSQSKEIPDVTNKFLLQNAHVTLTPGQNMKDYDILIEDGLITGVGTNIDPPFDAEIIKADSLYIYAGFIASLSQAGVPKAKEAKDPPKIKNPGLPPNDVAGISPERKLRDVLNPKDKSIADFREQGFGISHSVPRGKMLPGMGSIILLAGNSVDEMMIKEDVSLFATLATASRVYPATVIAVMSKYREMFRQAKYGQSHESTFKTNSNGIKRPSYDKSITALYPVINKQLPVFFKTEKSLDIQRALQLKNDLNFTLYPTEIKQGMRDMNKLKSLTSPMMLSLDLPKKEKEKKSKSDKKDKEEEIEETKLLKDRKLKSYNEYLSQAQSFEKSGIPFSFSFLEVKVKDIKTNLIRLVENGLSEKAALAAITTNPAKMLGISNLAGSIEKGKLANLVVSTKSFFDKESKIKFVFVEGTKFEIDLTKKKDKKSSEDETKDLSGVYAYSLAIPGQPVEGTLKISKDDDDDNYNVVITTKQNPSESTNVSDAKQEGDKLKFSYKTDIDGSKAKIDVDLDFDEDKFKGNVTAGDSGKFPVTGKKTDPK